MLQEWTDGLGSRIMRGYQTEETTLECIRYLKVRMYPKYLSLLKLRSLLSIKRAAFTVALSGHVAVDFFWTVRRALTTSGQSLMVLSMPFGLRTWTPCWMITWLSVGIWAHPWCPGHHLGICLPCSGPQLPSKALQIRLGEWRAH